MGEEEKSTVLERLNIIQRIMIKTGIIDLIMNCISYEEEMKAQDRNEYLKMAKEALELMNSLLSN